MKLALLLIALTCPLQASSSLAVPGLQQEVEILRDRWGVPHIYAKNTHDLFFAQGYITAQDRLFQIDLWRRVGTGKLAEVLGPQMIGRDQLARAVNFHGDWNREWSAYGPDAKAIVTAFTEGIDAYITGLGGTRTAEFAKAGYDPGLWVPKDCLSRVAGLLMTGNLRGEVQRAAEAAKEGLAAVERDNLFDPPVKIAVPKGLDLTDITAEVIRTYNEAVGPVALTAEMGSNNWVVDGTMTATGRPILANDPHRPVQLPSLRKTVHLVAPGWDAIGSGEPGLPGIALGHNQTIAFGFTIVGVDQQDLYVETVNPENADEYKWQGAWKRFATEQQRVKVKGAPDRMITIRSTVHGPVIHEDAARHRAYALRWVGMEPGTAGYLAGIALARAKNWTEFSRAMESYRVPSENVIYADTSGNIGWRVGGLTPVRNGWDGLFPVPGAEGQYEWSGFRKPSELPWEFNPARHYIATANNNIMPAHYPTPLGYDTWALPFRVNRIREMLTVNKKLDVGDFERMQQDVTSLPARRFQAVLRKWSPAPDTPATRYQKRLLAWDGVLRAESAEALLYEVWLAQLQTAALKPEAAGRANLELLLRKLESSGGPQLLSATFDAALAQTVKLQGSDDARWQWGKLHKLTLQHPLKGAGFDLAPVARPGDASTVNATSGVRFQQAAGASWREILDVGGLGPQRDYECSRRIGRPSQHALFRLISRLGSRPLPSSSLYAQSSRGSYRRADCAHSGEVKTKEQRRH